MQYFHRFLVSLFARASRDSISPAPSDSYLSNIVGLDAAIGKRVAVIQAVPVPLSVFSKEGSVRSGRVAGLDIGLFDSGADTPTLGLAIHQIDRAVSQRDQVALEGLKGIDGFLNLSNPLFHQTPHMDTGRNA